VLALLSDPVAMATALKFLRLSISSSNIVGDGQLQKEHPWSLHVPAIQLSNHPKAAMLCKGSDPVHRVRYRHSLLEGQGRPSGRGECLHRKAQYHLRTVGNRWLGDGFVSYRASSASHTEKVYGDRSHAGDVISVLLDCETCP
jgi:hypothetical protein